MRVGFLYYCVQVLEGMIDLEALNSLISLILGSMNLDPEYVFVARLVCVLLSVELITALLSAIVPIVRVTR